ncbi:MAG: polyprenyl synthetase family protein [Halocynthiibacter sp.]
MFKTALAADAALIETHLAQLIGRYPTSHIADAMTYAAQGGKRLRGFLTIESARIFDIDPQISIWPAAAIEAMHAYSLVHDDLPAMDDDDLRRGRPTVHVKWNDATAVLVGDALQTTAFEALSHEDFKASSDVKLALISRLATSSGAQGMVLGQALDIKAETADSPLSIHEIKRIQSNKTGELIEWSAVAGAVLAQENTAPLSDYARDIGLAFQIADDILDIEGTEAQTGKRVGKDEAAGKATFVTLLGLDAARREAHDLIEAACDAISCYGNGAENLQQAARFVIKRQN